jgi:hypothetical protein
VDCTKDRDTLSAGVAVIEKGTGQFIDLPLLETKAELPLQFVNLPHSVIEFNLTLICQASQT